MDLEKNGTDEPTCKSTDGDRYRQQTRRRQAGRGWLVSRAPGIHTHTHTHLLLTPRVKYICFPAAQPQRIRLPMQETRRGFDPGRKILGKEMATRLQHSCWENSRHRGSLKGCSPQGHRKSDPTEHTGRSRKRGATDPAAARALLRAPSVLTERGLHSPRQRSTATQLKSSDNTEREQAGGLSPEPSLRGIRGHPCGR